MEEIILIILSIFIIAILIEEIFREFTKVKLIIYSILLIIFLSLIRNYFSYTISITINYITVVMVVALPLLVVYYIISELLTKRENEKMGG